MGPRRLDRAAELLRDRNQAIGEVSAAVGFGSERTFRRAFRERFRCTPSRYRSEVRAARMQHKGGPDGPPL